MTKTNIGVEVGRLNERVEVRELLKTTDEHGTAWTWETVRKTWARAELMTRPNVCSVHGLGRRG